MIAISWNSLPTFENVITVDIARQLGLALHNVRLDNALQASLDDLQVANDELVASRARIVAATDESRRRIERNLHDGAQQHLVALAVKVGLVRQLLDADPVTATAMLDELRGDVQATLTELRELAHGIYPPRLRDRGLRDALVAAADRAPLPTTVDADGLGRYGPDLETAVYFCCLEAIQNAGKYAGPDASIVVRVGELDAALWFTVSDDGVGFDPAAVAESHGFVNMRDRLGAFAGDLEVTSGVGAGTTIRGSIPLS
jgi:signal transduction histidine kinase